MNWYRDAVTKFFKQYYKELTSTVLFIVLLVLYHLIFGGKFESRLICQLPEPSIPLRALSGLVFMTFGKVLYHLWFYFILHKIVVVGLRDKWLYKDIKRIIWYGMMFFMGFVVAPWIIDQLNKLFLAACNTPYYLTHLFPPYGLSLVAFVVYLIIIYRKKHDQYSKDKKAS